MRFPLGLRPVWGCLVGRLRRVGKGNGAPPQTFKRTFGGRITPSGRLVARKLDASVLDVEVNDRVRLGERVIGHGAPPESLRVADSQSVSLAIDIDAGGVGTVSATGRPPQGEEGTDDAARTLLRVLNGRGGRWTEVVSLVDTDDDADCELRGGGNVLRLQVTRPLPQSDWEKLARTPQGLNRAITAASGADEIFQAVDKKAHRLPMDSRRRLVLVIDATKFGAYSLPPFVQAFKPRHGSATRALGFQAVWLVGPTEELTHELA